MVLCALLFGSTTKLNVKWSVIPHYRVTRYTIHDTFQADRHSKCLNVFQKEEIDVARKLMIKMWVGEERLPFTNINSMKKLNVKTQ